MRDHQPVTFDKFLGLWKRGDIESVPLDHFSDCNNVKFFGENAFATRDGIDHHQNVVVPLGDILRIYNYPTLTGNTILVLTSGGKIYHVVDATTTFGPILTIPLMTDFGFVAYAGRAYITPFTTEVALGLNRERGLQNEFMYVYLGAGAPARKAAGNKPVGTVTVANGAAGFTDAGTHVFGVVYETDTGYLTAPAAFASFVTGALLSVSFSTVPVSPDAFVTKRHIVASKVIQTFNGDLDGYDLFFIPGATIPNNVGTTLSNISFFDIDLVSDATHLKDNFSEIKAGVGITTYHNRLCIYTEFDNPSLVRVSAVGEPEAINQINGLLVVPPDGNYITNASELRDVFYVMKRNRTCSFVDNDDVPASWQLTTIDNAMGCGVHGIASVIDTGYGNIDYLVVASQKGIMLFNGRYILPELSWKVQALWISQLFETKFRIIQLNNDVVKQIMYCIMIDRTMLVGDYSQGFDPKNIKWTPWTFDLKVNSIALINVSQLLLGCDQV